MKNRPWPILIFGLTLLAMPLFNIFWNFLFFSTNVSFEVYATQFITKNSGLQFAESFLLYPLAGIGVLLMRKWSYWGFVLVSTWIIGRNFQIWLANPETISFLAMAAFSGTNLAMLGYYFLPSVRRVFFDSKLRWWEMPPRYATDLNAKIKISGGAFPCHLANVSQNGALLQTGFKFGEDRDFHLNFDYDGKSITLPCAVVHHIDTRNYGIQFKNTGMQQETMAWVTQCLKSDKAEVINAPDPLKKSFGNWLNDLGHGRGFTPQIH